MSKHITTTNLKWICVLAFSTIVLVLRIIDFVDEAFQHNFHMSRIGLEIMGTHALIIQLAMIFSTGIILWISSGKLFGFQYQKM